MDREDKRGIFFGVVGVLTLIVAIIGASFAWFSINARSSTNAVDVSAATVNIEFTEGRTISMKEIIPATKQIAMTTFARGMKKETYKGGEDGNTDIEYTTCVDNNNYKVCGYYDFSLTNNGTNPVMAKAFVDARQLVVANPEDPDSKSERGFKNLSYTLYDRSDITGTTDNDEANNGTEKYSGVFAVDAGTGNYKTTGYGLFNEDVNTTFEIGAKTTKKYRLFIWLNEAGEDNNEEQGAVFQGTIKVELPDAETITGVA